MDRQKIRTIKKNNEYSVEYRPGDIFIVNSAWYGGVNVTSVSGIPLSPDRDEYEVLKDEGQSPRPIDVYSYEVGATDCFCKVVPNGPKKLAMSHPCDIKTECGSYPGQVQRLCTEYGIRYYSGDQALIIDLFPRWANKDKSNYLFFRAEDVLERYMALKERQRCLTRGNRYAAQARYELAVEFGLFLSCPEGGIARLTQEATGRQQTESYNGVFSGSGSI